MTKQYIRILRTNISSLDFRLKKGDEIRNYFLEKIKYNNLMSEKYKRTCKYLNYVKNMLTLASTVAGCVSIYVLASLVCVPVGIMGYAVG